MSKIASLHISKDCNFETVNGAKSLGDKVPPFLYHPIGINTRLEIKQTGCEQATYTLTATQLGTVTAEGEISFLATTYFSQPQKVTFTDHSFTSSGYDRGAYGGREGEVPVYVGGTAWGKWGLQKEKNGGLRIFATGAAVGYFFILPVAGFYKNSCRFVRAP